MNETINLTRARVIEFTDSGGDAECLVKRDHVSNLLFTGIRSNGPETKLGSYRLENIRKHCTNIRILAEFPLTLADLIPGDCQAFRFKHNGLTNTAVFDMVFKAWAVTGHDGWYATLESLAEHFEIELDTVAPLALTTHPDYVEGRR